MRQMLPLPKLLLMAGTLWAFLASAPVTVCAQEFRVYTTIHDVRGTSSKSLPGSRPASVGRSTTLFHAGKVYDSHASNQMTIFEPAHEQFVLVDDARRISTIVPFAFLQQTLYRAEKEAQRKLEQMGQSATRNADRGIALANSIAFQIDPVFQEQFDPRARKLELKGKELSYSVQCAPPPDPELVEVYLSYADWAARLNYVMNQRAMLPTARIHLNECLRKRRLLPVEVNLQIHQPGGLSLAAEHRYEWKLNAHDRDVIHHWNQLLTSGQIEQVTLEKYRDTARADSGRERR